MGQDHLITGYRDLQASTDEKSAGFFFLEKVLNARIALDLNTGTHEYDEEVNVYIGYLLMSLVTSDAFLKVKPYVSPYDADVRHYLDEHPGSRAQYCVYRENADFGLVSESLFLGYDHPGSYHRRVLSDRDDESRIALYYELAASALIHLTCANAALVHVLVSISDNIGEVIALLRKVAADYFEFIERISSGSLFHLEKDISRMADDTSYQRKLDEFLRQYADYMNAPTPERHSDLLAMVAELKKLNTGFCFDEGKLAVPPGL
jgi:hypothetical protein